MVGNAEENDDVYDDSCDVLTQLKNDGIRSSAHSTVTLSDSISASDFEYGNDSKSDLTKTLNESLQNWDAVLQTKHKGGRPERLNTSFGSLTKTTSVREFDGPKSSHPRRRSSIHGCIPSYNFEGLDGHASFRSEFKASVDDWNSELPVESDDEEPSFSQLNASVKSIRDSDKSKKASTGTPERDSRVDSVPSLHGNDTKLPERKETKGKSKEILDCMESADVGTGISIDQSVESDAKISRSRILPMTKSSRLKAKSPDDASDCDNCAISSLRFGKNKDRKVPVEKSGSSSKLESRFALSVRTIRGGMSFRSNGSTSSHSSISNSQHVRKSKSTSVDGPCVETAIDSQLDKKKGSFRRAVSLSSN